MTARIKTRTHRVTTAEIPNVGEVVIEMTPEGDELHSEQVGNKLVVAYLVRDDHPSNPMTDDDCNGEVFLAGRNNSIWDDTSRVRSELCCGDGRWSGEEPDIDAWFQLPTGRKVSLRELATDAFLEREGLITIIDRWFEDEDLMFDEGETYETCFQQNQTGIRSWASELDEVEDLAREMYGEHWDRLVGPFVVPISYRSHYDTRIEVDTWDGDPENLPDGVWVADESCIENLLWEFHGQYLIQTGSVDEIRRTKLVSGEFHEYSVNIPILDLVVGGVTVVSGLRGRKAWGRAFMEHVGYLYFDKLRSAARNYAEGVCKTLSAWVSGDVYGCIVETFENTAEEGDEPVWEQVDIDSCWGFYGIEYAEENLMSEFFEPTVSRLKGDVENNGGDHD